jgi:prepilin-type N-terminal cleavage/methylation domain-containing protein
MPHHPHGFSLMELVIAMALTSTVLACVFALARPAQDAFAVQPEVADMQQRLRIAGDALTRDLAGAGAGAYLAGHSGPLIRFFAPVLPFRQGLSSDDAPGTMRTDAVTVIAVPATAAQTTLVGPLMPGVLTLQTAPEAGCPAGTNLCGFSAGLTIAIYDDSGNFGVFTVAEVTDEASQITLTSRPDDSLSTTYRSGSNVVQVQVDTFALKADMAAQAFQLTHADGSARADVPLVDHVVGLAFDYYGEPRPPALESGTASYGPAPPPVGVQTTAYPPGENCGFQIDPASGEPVARLSALAPGTALVPLTAAQLTDGPWCPDEANANRWDADLLRIRTVGVTVRVEVASAALRGPARLLFVHPGWSTSPNRSAPDLEIRFQVSPRNVNVGRQ